MNRNLSGKPVITVIIARLDNRHHSGVAAVASRRCLISWKATGRSLQSKQCAVEHTVLVIKAFDWQRRTTVATPEQPMAGRR